MNPFCWSDNHAIGLHEIDADHRALLRMAEQLYDEIESGTVRDGLDGLLARLAAYAQFHFASEEALMRRTRFPGYPQHRREHEKFANTISCLRTMTRSECADVAETLMEFLGSWIEQHTCGEDHRMVEHIKLLEPDIHELRNASKED